MKISFLGWSVVVGRERGSVVRERRPLLSDETVVSVLAMSEDAVIWQALMQVLDDHEQDQVAMVARVELADKPGALAFLAGGLDGLKTLRETLETIRKRGVGAAAQGS
jgi:hypothetical protein